MCATTAPSYYKMMQANAKTLYDFLIQSQNIWKNCLPPQVTYWCLPQAVAEDFSIWGPGVRVTLAVTVLVGGGCPDRNIRLFLWLRVGKCGTQKGNKDNEGFHFKWTFRFWTTSKFQTDGLFLKTRQFYSLSAQFLKLKFFPVECSSSEETEWKYRPEKWRWTKEIEWRQVNWNMLDKAFLRVT